MSHFLRNYSDLDDEQMSLSFFSAMTMRTKIVMFVFYYSTHREDMPARVEGFL